MVVRAVCKCDGSSIDFYAGVVQGLGVSMVRLAPLFQRADSPQERLINLSPDRQYRGHFGELHALAVCSGVIK